MEEPIDGLLRALTGLKREFVYQKTLLDSMSGSLDKMEKVRGFDMKPPDLVTIDRDTGEIWGGAPYDDNPGR